MGIDIPLNFYHSLGHIPLAWHSRINEAFCDGYQALFRFLRDFISTAHIPTTENVADGIRTKCQESTKNKIEMGYLAQGGQVQWALDCITYWAHSSSEYDKPSFSVLMQDDPAWMQLPECRNDKAFGLVRLEMGLDPNVMWGPFKGL